MATTTIGSPASTAGSASGIYSVQAQVAGRVRFAGACTDAPLWFARFLRNGHTLGIRYSINAISEDFQAQSGFIGRAGVVNALLVHSLTGHGKPVAPLERFGGDVQLNGTWKYDDFVHGRESQDRKLHFNTSATLRAVAGPGIAVD